MKNRYLFLLLATNVLSVFCMEKERHYNYNNSDKTMIPVYTLATPPQINNQNNSPSVYCHANESGWEFLDNIMNMTYKSEQPSIMTEVPLAPIYKPAHTNITQQEQKSLLQTSVLKKTNPALMEQLCDNAYQYIDYERTTEKPDWMTSHKNLTFLIHNMNIAKEHNLTEDDMGKFAYQSYNRNATTKYIPLIFALLKRYNCTVNDTKEALPFFTIDVCDENLSRMFAIESPKNNSNISPKSDKELAPHPAYLDLVNKLKTLDQQDDTQTHLTSCLYANDKILFSGYTDGTYTNLLSDFYIKTYNMFYGKDLCYRNLYETVLMINKAKKLNAIKKETDLGYTILNYDVTQCSMLEKIMHWGKKIDFKIDTKNRIALFCKLIEKYNNTETNKKRPTSRQYPCYIRQKNLNLILPSTMTSLDENHYAFTAFGQFAQDCIDLANSQDDQGIQLSVNKVYYNKEENK
jgi:hypothetical protein